MDLPKTVSSERRAHPRIEVELFGWYQFADSPEAEQKATVLNVSGAGICLYSNELIQEGQKLKLTVQLDPQEKVVLSAAIVWLKPIADTKRYRAGVRITKLDGEDFEDFLVFYYERMAEHSGQFDM